VRNELTSRINLNPRKHWEATQARELEKLIGHVEQVTAHLPEGSEMSVIRSSLSGLHLCIRNLRGTDSADTREGGEGPATSTGK
jgi:hypothetical protein